MSLLRFDRTTNDWVVYSPSRALRPHDTRLVPSADGHAEPATCPFCPGNEALTPPEIFAVRPPRGLRSDWSVRVVSNKFPALRIEEDPSRRDEGAMFRSMGGCGAHEVIVESREHTALLCQQPISQIESVLATLQRRLSDLMGDRRFQSIIIFKNHGASAGTSIRHPHWQLIATPVTPRLLRLKQIEATEYFDQTGKCLYCVLLEAELAAGRRILAQNDDYVALCPYASHVPFETWILPRLRQASFGHVSGERLKSLAELLKVVLLKLHTALDNPDFNLTIDTASRGAEDEEYFAWHLRILPRLSTPAGFELGSGMSINTVLPEDAVAFLSEVAVTANHGAANQVATGGG
ncbi:MAG: galactose-1-phosphate uridylyltransferase [Pirellulales bacterium]|nr:galactose-1-phosphate uridylyltransferase [Pirellulales bacterium]